MVGSGGNVVQARVGEVGVLQAHGQEGGEEEKVADVDVEVLVDGWAE